ncbi:hypothetical protein [Streptomyces sp. 130]|nr:hypothetical protein [Streptomyces sp. 130]
MPLAVDDIELPKMLVYEVVAELLPECDQGHEKDGHEMCTGCCR